MNFVTIDYETANRHRHSICQVGLTLVEQGHIADTLSFLVNPECEVALHNTKIHKICAEDLENAPKLSEVMPLVLEFLADGIAVSHSKFDQQCTQAASELLGISIPNIQWLDSVEIARRVWPDKFHKNAKLDFVANTLGIQFHHHDAGHDAHACAEITLRAIAEIGGSMNDLILLCDSSTPLTEPVGPENPIDETRFVEALVGKSIVFTGDLSISRDFAQDLAKRAGLTVKTNVSRKTDFLVEGTQDPDRIKHSEKSQKQLRADALIAQGHGLQILSETEFLALVRD